MRIMTVTEDQNMPHVIVIDTAQGKKQYMVQPDGSLLPGKAWTLWGRFEGDVKKMVLGIFVDETGHPYLMDAREEEE